jgi:hypothetical protein
VASEQQEPAKARRSNARARYPWAHVVALIEEQARTNTQCPRSHHSHPKHQGRQRPTSFWKWRGRSQRGALNGKYFSSSTELFDLDEGRRAHRRPDEPDPLVRIAVSLCCAPGDNATTVARYLDNAFNPGKRAGSKHRIDYLAKRTRQALAKLSPAEVEELAASMRQPLTAKIVGSGITTVARR